MFWLGLAQKPWLWLGLRQLKTCAKPKPPLMAWPRPRLLAYGVVLDSEGLGE